MTKEFIADLEYVFASDASDDIPLGDLKDLGQWLTKWSEYCRQELDNEFSKLPADHPAKCPISLFGVMKMGRVEVAHTRTLAWLLDPDNTEHGFGNSLLRAVLRDICECDHLLSFDGCKVEAERVYRNPLAEDAGRTDVWIECKPRNSKPWLVVIEAKIDASEEHRQLDGYNGEIKKWAAAHHDGAVYRVFLTPDGRSGTSGRNWKSASFSRLARVLWDVARFHPTKPGYHFLRHYLASVLKDILGLPIGRANGQQRPYKLLAFLKEHNATT